MAPVLSTRLITVDTLQTGGIGLRSLHENIDTTNAAFGQFEVEPLRERT